METKTQVPLFNVSLRGYDREEVDEYLDSLAEALERIQDADEQNRRLQTHINRLNARIRELEDQVQSNAPRTGVVLGERVGAILREAEDAAAEIMRKAEDRAAAAEEIIGGAVMKGEEEARRIVAAARAEAAGLITESEARASARTAQIEQWAEQVMSQTRAEEARILREQQERKVAAAVELKALASQRQAAASVLNELRDTLGNTLGFLAEPAEEAQSIELRESQHTDASTSWDPVPATAFEPPDPS